VILLPTWVAVDLPIGEHLNWQWPALFGPKILWQLHVDTVGLTLLTCAILLALGLFIRSRVTSGPPSRLQNAVEAVIQFLNGIIEENLGRDPGTIATIALTLFFFIWVANMIGLLPIPHMHSPTSDVNATFALALLVFILLHVRYVRTSGVSAYKGHYWSNKWWAWFTLNPVSVILGVVNELSRPLTLAFRLFGNIIAGEVLLIVWAFLLPTGAGVPVTAIWNAVFVAYGVFVGTIQAFIFTVLTVAYMAIASEPAHDH
jgi:F-type H+-transporting ATPase subunit a